MRLNYDRYGNMVSEKWYDSKNEPTYEYVYAYDNAGNIVKPIDKALLKEYNYTSVKLTLSSLLSIIYTYDDCELKKKHFIYGDNE